VRFGTPQTGAAAQEPLGRPQLGGLFAQTASTPAGTPRFGRQATCLQTMQDLLLRCRLIRAASSDALGHTCSVALVLQAPGQRHGHLATAGGRQQAAAGRQPPRAAWAPREQPQLDAHARRRS
jgi:hypothetical protein